MIIRILVVWYRLTPFLIAFLRDRRRWILVGPPRFLSDEAHRARAQKLTATIASLGPSFIKLAQVFGIRADIVTYGKTLGGGLPVGVVCGRKALMKRFRDDRPTDICFARGTFNSHPYVMAAMNEFLQRLETPELRDRYRDLDETWNGRVERLNQRLRDADLPVQVANLSTIWTTCYTRPSRYNWMLQYYLRAEGLALSWIGTGRFIFSLDYTDTDFDAVAERFLAAAEAMREDGWWWLDPATTNRSIRRRIVREMIARRF